MKTHIIQLGENEDAISLRDRMSWCKTKRILLVSPPNGPGISRLYDFVLLKRHAAALGAELAIVSQAAQERFLAEQCGVLVFTSVSRADEQEWHVTPPPHLDSHPAGRLVELGQQRQSIEANPPHWFRRPGVRYACVGLCVLAIFSLLVVLLPGAQVVLSPRSLTQSAQFNIMLGDSATKVDYSNLAIPASLQDVTVEGSQVISTTGSVVIPFEHATGSLEFTNHTSHEVTIPPGTIVSTQDAAATSFITLPSEPVGIAAGDSTTLDARALNPGISGNLPAGTLVAIQGDLAYALTVTNPELMRGGSNATTPSPVESDLQSLREQLNSQLSRQALDQLHASLPPGDIVVTPNLTVTQVLDESFAPSIGEPGEQLEMHLKLKLQAQVVSGEALSRLLTPLLNSHLPPGYLPVKDSLVVTPLWTPERIDVAKASWRVSASRQVKAVLLHDLAAEAIKGASVSHAVTRLSAYLPLENQARISTSPGWWPWLPILAMRIDVVEVGQP